MRVLSQLRYVVLVAMVFLWAPLLHAQSLRVNNAALRFTTTSGASALPSPQSVSVQSTPNGLAFTVAVTGPAPHNGAWLLVNAASGRAPQTLSVQPNPTGLPAGTYTAVITLTATSGTPAPTATVNVTLVVGTPPPTITVSPTAMVFQYTVGEAVSGNPSLSSTFVLSNTGAATAATISVQSAPWLRVTPTGNITLAGLFNSISVSVDPTGLAPRLYTASITIRSTNSANPTLTVPVSFQIEAPAPTILGTWPMGVMQQSPQSTATLVGRGFFTNTTVAMTGFTPETTISVSDGTNTASESFHIPVYPAGMSILRCMFGSPLPGGSVGIGYSPLALAAAGGTPPYTWSVRDGVLPPGLVLAGNSLSGTPTAAGTYYFSLAVTDSANPLPASAYMPVKLVVLPGGALASPRIAGPNALLPAGGQNTAYPSGIHAVAVGGGGGYSWSATALPPGLALDSGSGQFSGTPLGVGNTGPLTARSVGDNAMLVTVPATQLTQAGYLRLTATTPSPGGGSSNEGHFQIYGPRPQIAAVVDSASFQQGTISPGQIITIFGLGLGPSTLTLFNPAAPAPQIPNALPAAPPSTSATVNGVPAPVLYTSNNQVSLIVPYSVTGATADLVLTYGGVASQPFTLTMAATSPGIYTTDASGSGQGAILNYNNATQDYSLNSPSTPASRGQLVVLYVSGMGSTTSPVANTLVPLTPPVTPLAAVSVTIGGQPAVVAGAASPPGSVPGLLQINVTVPANAPVGTNVPVSVTIGGVESQTGVTMSIR